MLVYTNRGPENSIAIYDYLQDSVGPCIEVAEYSFARTLGNPIQRAHAH